MIDTNRAPHFYRALLIVCLMITVLARSEATTYPFAWRLASFLPAVLTLALTLLVLERRDFDGSWPLPTAWLSVFTLVMLGFLISSAGERVDLSLMSLLFLGLVIVTARTPFMGALVGLMAGGGLLYIAHLHHISIELELLGRAAAMLPAGLLAGYMSHEADVQQEQLALQTAALRRELADLGEHLKNVLSCITSGVLVVDAEHQVTTFNRAAQRILGVPEHAVLGRDITTSSQLATLVPVLDEGDEADPRQDLEFDRPDGQRIRIGYATSPLENVAARRLGTIVVFQDVTIIRDYEARMLRQEQLAALGRMVSGIAHEFGNILGGARGLLDLAMQDEPDEAVKTLPTVRENLARALETVENLLRFARGTPLNPIPGIELGAVIERSLHLLTAELEKREVEVIKRFDEVPPLCADAIQLEQVFINIILNAIHAVDGREERKLRITLSSQNAHTRIEFEDTGPGIPRETRERIFEPFFTTKGSLGGSEVPGTGLGLAMALGVIQHHNGTLEVGESADLTGACLTVTLPVESSEDT